MGMNETPILTEVWYVSWLGDSADLLHVDISLIN